MRREKRIYKYRYELIAEEIVEYDHYCCVCHNTHKNIYENLMRESTGIMRHLEYTPTTHVNRQGLHKRCERQMLVPHTHTNTHKPYNFTSNIYDFNEPQVHLGFSMKSLKCFPTILSSWRRNVCANGRFWSNNRN